MNEKDTALKLHTYTLLWGKCRDFNEYLQARKTQNYLEFRNYCKSYSDKNSSLPFDRLSDFRGYGWQ